MTKQHKKTSCPQKTRKSNTNEIQIKKKKGNQPGQRRPEREEGGRGGGRAGGSHGSRREAERRYIDAMIYGQQIFRTVNESRGKVRLEYLGNPSRTRVIYVYMYVCTYTFI